MSVSDASSSPATPTTQGRGKRSLTAAAGPYGHPFHPLLVTVPIGAWVTSLVFDIASRNADPAGTFARGAYWLIVVGIIGAIVAAVFGLLDLLAIGRATRAFRVGLFHMAFNLVTLALFVVSRVMRGGDLDQPTSVVLIVLSVVALATLGVSGWLGGMLAYRYGVRVADEATQAEAFRKLR